jgi:uncharacterized repeat protein (TIGR01451 family)
MSGTISTVQVRLNGLTHTDPDDLDMVLVAPDGRAFVFWSDIGGVRGTNNVCPNAPFACSINNFTITVSDSGSTLLPDGNGASGQDARVLVNNTTYKPANNGVGADAFPDSGVTVSAANSAANSPTVAGLGGTATFASSFGGSGNINGEWKLYIALDSCCGPTGSDAGSLTSWSLILTTNVANAATTTSLTSTVNPSLVGNNVTITSTVTAGGNPVTLGSVSFFEGALALQTNVPLNASGQASFTTSALTEGAHVITANYSGATGFGTSSGTLTQVVDRPTTVSGNSFCNVGPITIPNTINASGTPYPSKLFVTGLAGTTQKITMDLKGFTHPVPEDVDLLLVSPTGQKYVPFASVAGIVGVSNINLTLDDAAASLMPSTGALPGGTYRPSAFASATFLAPAPAGPYQFAASQGSATFISTFSGTSPNGTWQLFASSHGAGTAGTRQFGGGWCLNFTTSSDPATTTTPSVSPSPSALNQSVTVSALVANASNSAPVNGLGTVNFTEGSTPLAGPLNVGSNGVASFTKSDFTQGAHFLTANYSGSPGNFGVSNGTVLHFVDAPTTNPSAGRYCNASAVTFPNVVNASGAPYPTRVQVSGLAGTVNKVTVELNGVSHQFPDDMDMLLSGPNGNSLVLFSDVGGANAANGLNLVLDSSAASALPDTAALSSGTFRPTDFQAAVDTFAAPAPTTNVFSASVTSLTTAFSNINPNGTWALFTTNDGAGAQGGGSLGSGWCLNFTMNNPDLTISKSHVGNFTQGQAGAQYSLVVGSNGPGTTVGTVTVVDDPPPGLTITAMSGSGWNCTVGTRTCTTSAPLASGATYPPIAVTVTVATNASSPQVNSATVSADFDPGSAGNNTATDSTIIVQVPDLTISKSTSSSFVQGGSAAFSLVVNNSGAGASSGAYTISDNLPTGLTLLGVPTGSGWDCSASTANVVSCVRATSIAALGSAPAVTVDVNVAPNASPSITNTATVAGGGELNTGNNSGSVTVNVTALTPVTITVPAGVSFTLNSVSYTGSQTVNLAPGQYVLSTTTPQSLAAGTRAEFVNWSDAGAISHSITVGASPLVITGNFTTQHQLTTVAGTGGTVTPASGSFFDAGTVVNVTATPSSGFVFANWTGPVANSNAAATTATMSAPATVTANFDPAPILTISSPSLDEGDAGTSVMNFVVSLSAISGREVSFTRATSNGTATIANNDYVPLSAETVTIPAGEPSVTIGVTINGDTLFEDDESFSLNITGVSNAIPSSLIGVGTIVNDDPQPTTTTILSHTPDPTVTGQPYLVSVNVVAQSSSPLGSVTIRDGAIGSPSCTATLTVDTAQSSSAGCQLTSTSAGSKTLTAEYTPASAELAPSSGTATHQVNPAGTSISVVGPARSRINQPVDFSFALSVNPLGAGAPAGTVTLSSGVHSCSVSVPTLAPSCALSFSTIGARTVVAAFEPSDGNYLGSSSSGAGNAQTLVFAVSDLVITKSNGLSTYDPGDLIVYTVTLRNLGPDTAANIRVRDQIPAGLGDVVWSCDASGGAVCASSGGSGDLDVTLPNLVVGGLLNYTFYGNVVGSPDQIINTALVELPADTTIEDPVPGNNSATDTDLLDQLFENGFEAALVQAPMGSYRLPSAVLRGVLNAVAIPMFSLDDFDGEAVRVYARVLDGQVQYALAQRNSAGALRLGAWRSYSGEPTLRWVAQQQDRGWVVTSAELD